MYVCVPVRNLRLAACGGVRIIRTANSMRILFLFSFFSKTAARRPLFHFEDAACEKEVVEKFVYLHGANTKRKKRVFILVRCFSG